MPKTHKYEGNVVIYCKGDSATAFYVLKSGRVCVSSDDRMSLDSNKNLSLDQIITPGGFFGAQAFLGGFPQREVAVCVLPSEVVVFTIGAFEKMVEGNKDFVFHMLRVLSAELFVFHNRVTRLINSKEETPSVSPEDGFYNVANYLFSNRCYSQAVMAMTRYLDQYPQGKHVQICTRRVADAKSKIGRSYDESYKLIFKSNNLDKGQLETSQNEIEAFYEEALLMFKEEKYAPAIHKFSKILRKEDDPLSHEYEPSCMYHIGISFRNLNKVNEAIESFTELIKKYPQYEKIPDTMLYLANCYEEQGNTEGALVLYKKLSTILPQDSPLLESLKTKKGNYNFE